MEDIRAGDAVNAIAESASKSKKYILPFLSDIYLSIPFQIFLFVVSAMIVFVTGMILTIGVFAIPLIDKEKLIGMFILYGVIALAFVIVARNFFLILISEMIDIYKLAKTLPRKIFVIFTSCLFVIYLAVWLLDLLFSSYFPEITEVPAHYFIPTIHVILMSLVVLALWWKSRARSLFFFLIIGGLGVAFNLGASFMEYQYDKEADFLLKRKTNEVPLYVNILFKSQEGILVVDKSSNSPVFFPWDEVSNISVTPERHARILDRKNRVQKRTHAGPNIQAIYGIFK
jgi:hypothetical protein